MSTGFKTQCPHCQRSLRVQDRHVGKVVRCVGCGQSFEVKSVRGGGDSLEQTPDVVSVVQPSSTPSGTVSNRSGETSGSLPGLKQEASAEPTLEKLGRFEVKQLLGEGGFGRVYRAYDPQLDRFVALKVPTFSASDRSRVKRFLTEAKAAAQLRHPNIVPTFDSGTAGDKLYIASQFIAGQALIDRIKDSKVKVRDAARWVAKIAEAVQYAHDQGIVHRDIKPHNVMLDEKGEPQLMDFGLAKRLSEDSAMTVDGSLMGTPAYMSPEQARGDHANVGPLSDQYSVGVILYELLTGRKPFSGAPHAVITQVIEKDPTPVRQYSPSVPKDLDAICQKCMSKDPSRRYSDAAAMVADLHAWLEGRPVQARTPTIAERCTSWVKRNPVTAGLSSLLAVSLLLGTVISIWFALDANAQKTLAEAEATNARNAEAAERAAKKDIETERDKAVAAEAAAKKAEAEVILERDSAKTARDQAVAVAERARKAETLANQNEKLAEAKESRAMFHLAVSRWEANRVTEATELLNRIPEEHRNLEWRLASRLFDTSEVTCVGHTAPVVSVQYSNDGQRVLSASEDGSVRIWDSMTGELKTVLKGHEHPLVAARYTPDNQRIVSADAGGQITVWVANTGSQERTIAADSPLNGIAISADGRFIAAALGSQESPSDGIRIWDLTTAEEIPFRRPDDSDDGIVTCVDFSPDGTSIAWGCGQRMRPDFYVCEYPTGQQIASRKSFSGVARCHFSPSSRYVAATKTQYFASPSVILDTHTNQIIHRQMSVNAELIYSPDERWVAYASANDHSVHLTDLDGMQEIPALRGHHDAVRALAFRPDGNCLASGSDDHTIKIWSMIDKPLGSTIYTQGLADYGEPSVSSDGSRIAFSTGFGFENGIEILDLPTSTVVAEFRKDNCVFSNTAISPDGSLIVGCSGRISRAGDNYPRSIENVALVWNAKTGELIKSIPGSTGIIFGAVFTPDGKKLIIHDSNGELHVLNADTLQEDRRVTSESSAEYVKQIVFDSAGDVCVVCGESGTVSIWNCTTWERMKYLPATGVTACFSPDGERLFTSHNGVIHEFSSNTFEEVRHHDCMNQISRLVMPPDGSRLIAFGRGLRILDRQTFEELFHIQEMWLSSGAITSDSGFVAGLGAGRLAYWDIRVPDQRALSAMDRQELTANRVALENAAIRNGDVLRGAWDSESAFARMFNLVLLLRMHSGNVDDYLRFQLALREYRDINAEHSQWLPPSIQVALDLPEPDHLNERIQEIVDRHLVDSDFRHSVLKYAVDRKPTSDLKVRLAYSLYRRDEYSRALELTLDQTIEADPVASRTSLAIQALCHFKLDNKEQAAILRRQFEDSIPEGDSSVDGLKQQLAVVFGDEVAPVPPGPAPAGSEPAPAAPAPAPAAPAPAVLSP